ncbi:MAG TPA: hypothetical protein VKE88_00660 [Candidatus Nanoarchaeia archaeon]|nr:hypothetical protein [Candidatus Nanoarchaeia archaeon]
MERLYLMKTSEDEVIWKLGIFCFNKAGDFEPAIKPKNKELGFDNPSDLGTAVAKLFRSESKTIDAIEATEKIEASEFPVPFPHISWGTSMMIYDRMKSTEYIGIIKAMTEELNRK